MLLEHKKTYRADRSEAQTLRPDGADVTDTRDRMYGDIEKRRLKEWENYQRCHRSYDDQKANRAFIDISIAGELTGRLVFDLFDTVAPETVTRFRLLSAGRLGLDPATGVKLDYLGTSLDFVDKERHIIQFGDLSCHEVQIPPLKDESFALRHVERGLLTMISNGPNSATSGFGITLKEAPVLDFRQVVFGKVTDGFDLLDKLEALPTTAAGVPVQAVTITCCGVLTGERPPGH